MTEVSLLKMIKIEFNKLKRSKALISVMLIPFFFIITGLMNVFRYKEIMLNKDPWLHIYEQSALMYVCLFIPMLITIIMIILTRIEFKENNWKRILSLPVPRSKFYMAKFITGCILLLINILLFIIICVSAGIIFAHLKNVPSYVILNPLITFLYVLPIIPVHYYIAVKYENIALPLVASIILLIASMFIGATRFWYLFPWSYATKVVLIGTKFASTSYALGGFIQLLIGSAMFISFILLGIRYLNKKDIR